jgi:hypothetical protein
VVNVKNDWKKFVEYWETAAERERQLIARKPVLSPQESFRRSMALLAFAESAAGDPFADENPIDREEREKVQQTWANLRERWSGGR